MRWCCSVPPRFQASNAWPDRVFPGGFLVEPDETACCVWVPPELAVSATLVPRLNRASEAEEEGGVGDEAHEGDGEGCCSGGIILASQNIRLKKRI